MYSFALTSVTQFQLLIENFHIMLIKLLCTLLPPYIIYLASLRYSAVMDKLKSENAKTDAVPQSRIWPLFCNGDCLCVTEQGVCTGFSLDPSVRVPAACFGKWPRKRSLFRGERESVCVCQALETKRGSA